MHKVVANTTPLIVLGNTGHLDLLEKLYGEVSIPRAVCDEILKRGDDARLALLSSPEWLVVRSAPAPDDASLMRSRLHAGEVEAIMLARRCDADLVIIDDLAAKRTAKYLGLKTVGTLGVLLRAKERGYIDCVRTIVNELLDIGFFVSEDVLEAVLQAAGELPSE